MLCLNITDLCWESTKNIYSALRFIRLRFNRQSRFIRQKSLVPWNSLSLVMHLLQFIRLRFNRQIRIIRHKISIPWNKMHCFYSGLSGFHFFSRYNIHFRSKNMLNLVKDFKKSIRTTAPKPINFRRVAGTSVLIPLSQILEEISTKTG